MKSLAIFALLFTVSFASAFNVRALGNDTLQRQLFTPGMEIKEPGFYTRIINGQNAVANQFPYQVGLSFVVPAGNFWCGGSLIGQRWVLTAAHCTVGANSVFVYLGGIKRLQPAIRYTVAKANIIRHPSYNANNARHDIALVKIPAVTFTNAIQRIALPTRTTPPTNYAGLQAIASGWGRTSDASTASSADLKYGTFNIIANSVCVNSFPTNTIYQGKICTALNPSGAATCSGDSGGPLVLTSPKVLIGIVSFGSAEGCQKGYPDAYTRVDFYLNWIRQTTGIAV